MQVVTNTAGGALATTPGTVIAELGNVSGPGKVTAFVGANVPVTAEIFGSVATGNWVASGPAPAVVTVLP